MDKRVVSAFLSCFLCVGASTGYADVGSADLDLELLLDKKQYVAYTPACLVVRLCNRTGKAAWAGRTLDPEFGFLRVFLSKDGGEEEAISFRNEGLRYRLSDPGGPEYIGPGRETFSHRLVILHRYLKAPGTYQARAVLKSLDRKSELHSKSISLRVTAAPKHEEPSIGFLRKHKLIRLLSLHSVPPFYTDEDIKAMEKFLAAHAGSLFAPYVKAKLAKVLIEQGWPRRRLSDPIIIRAISLLTEAATAKGFIEAPDALYEVARRYVFSRKSKRAQAVCRQIIQGWPKSTGALDARRLLDRLIQEEDPEFVPKQYPPAPRPKR
jgi:hypothetical protein